MAAEIEHASYPLLFRPYSEAEQRHVPLTSQLCSAHFDQDRKVVSVCVAGQPARHMLLHELLHLQRWCAQGAPQLAPRGFAQWPEAMADLGNQVEHLSIVPMEMEAEPESRGYWEQCFLSSMNRWRPDGLVRFDLIKSAIFLRGVLPNSEAASLVEAALERHGLTDVADQHIPGILSSLDEPETAMARAVDAVGLGRDQFQLQYLVGSRYGVHNLP